MSPTPLSCAQNTNATYYNPAHNRSDRHILCELRLARAKYLTWLDMEIPAPLPVETAPAHERSFNIAANMLLSPEAFEERRVLWRWHLARVEGDIAALEAKGAVQVAA